MSFINVKECRYFIPLSEEAQALLEQDGTQAKGTCDDETNRVVCTGCARAEALDDVLVEKGIISSDNGKDYSLIAE